MKKINIKFSTKKIIFYIYSFTFLCVVIVLSLTSIYLYNNFFQSVTLSDQVLSLKKVVSSQMVNLQKFNTVMDKIGKKTASSTQQKINNPFD